MIPFIDLHEDLASAYLDPKLAAQTDFAQLEQANIKVVVGTGFTLPEESLSEVIVRDISRYKKHCDIHPKWSMITTGSDVTRIIESPTERGILFHVEGFPGFNEDWEIFDGWYEVGLRSAGLVWNDDNALGGGTYSDIGLSHMGEEFIARCEEKCILIDFAHMNQTMFKDALAVVTRPPFISHGGLHTLVPNRRNFTDQQLQDVVERGGVVGIFFSKNGIAKDNTYSINDLAVHIRTAINVLGEDAVALGTDFGGILSGLPKEIPSVSKMESLWRVLKSKKVTETQIEKVAYHNAARYLINTLPLYG